jgi:hypothetical protein
MRRIIVMDRCCLCKRNGKPVDHLLLHCNVASAIWSAFFSCFGLSWVMPRSVVDLLNCWWSFGKLRSSAVWKMVPTCLFWCVWKERNDRCFIDRERTLGQILSLFYKTLYVSSLSISFSDFLVCFALLLVEWFFLYFQCT